MKVVHLSTSDMGGAGIAAKNLHLKLTQLHWTSSMVTKVKLGFDFVGHFCSQPNQEEQVNRSFLQRVKASLQYRLPWLFPRKAFSLQGREKGFEYFSLPFSDLNLSSIPAIHQADVIHLHWISDQFVDYQKVFELNKKYVWTLHDMNPFTGGCHHSDGCMLFNQDCSSCFQLKGTQHETYSKKILEYKLKALSNLRDDQMKIVAPSEWLLKLSQKSICFSRFEHIHIPNVIDFNIAGADREDIRKKWLLDDREIVFLFVAHDVRNTRKGLGTLMHAIENLSDKSNLVLMVLGQSGGLMIEGVRVLELGFVTDQTVLRNAYLAADVFLMPSIAENFPNTIIESLLLGTPVIASAVGGIPEQLNESNGVLIHSHDYKSWISGINYFLQNRHLFERGKMAKEAMGKYNSTRITEKYIQVYHSL